MYRRCVIEGAVDKNQAYNGMLSHIGKLINNQGGSYSDWYCGIASDLDKRLFEEHYVPRDNWWYTTRRCFNDADARAVETALQHLGCYGEPGDGDETSVYVYAYLRGDRTNP